MDSVTEQDPEVTAKKRTFPLDNETYVSAQGCGNTKTDMFSKATAVPLVLNVDGGLSDFQ